MNEYKKILGGDLSHHNKSEQIIAGLSFYFLKATEGTTYKDEKMTALMEFTWRISNFTVPIYGFYHYARPDLNPMGSKREADRFLDTIKPHIGQCLIALDWEGKSLECGLDWALEWLNYIKEKTGIRPFFYSSASYLQKCKNIKTGRKIHDEYPLWVAHYGKEDKYADLKKTGNIWQFTSTPLDLDIYYGTYVELAQKAIPI